MQSAFRSTEIDGGHILPPKNKVRKTEQNNTTLQYKVMNVYLLSLFIASALSLFLFAVLIRPTIRWVRFIHSKAATVVDESQEEEVVNDDTEAQSNTSPNVTTTNNNGRGRGDDDDDDESGTNDGMAIVTWEYYLTVLSMLTLPYAIMDIFHEGWQDGWYMSFDVEEQVRFSIWLFVVVMSINVFTDFILLYFAVWKSSRQGSSSSSIQLPKVATTIAISPKDQNQLSLSTSDPLPRSQNDENNIVGLTLEEVIWGKLLLLLHQDRNEQEKPLDRTMDLIDDNDENNIEINTTPNDKSITSHPSHTSVDNRILAGLLLYSIYPMAVGYVLLIHIQGVISSIFGVFLCLPFLLALLTCYVIVYSQQKEQETQRSILRRFPSRISFVVNVLRINVQYTVCIMNIMMLCYIGKASETVGGQSNEKGNALTGALILIHLAIRLFILGNHYFLHHNNTWQVIGHEWVQDWIMYHAGDENHNETNLMDSTFLLHFADLSAREELHELLKNKSSRNNKIHAIELWIPEIVPTRSAMIRILQEFTTNQQPTKNNNKSSQYYEVYWSRAVLGERRYSEKPLWLCSELTGNPYYTSQRRRHHQIRNNDNTTTTTVIETTENQTNDRMWDLMQKNHQGLVKFMDESYQVLIGNIPNQSYYADDEIMDTKNNDNDYNDDDSDDNISKKKKKTRTFTTISLVYSLQGEFLPHVNLDLQDIQHRFKNRQKGNFKIQ